MSQSSTDVVPHDFDATSSCGCPSCRLAYYMTTTVYGSQRLASEDVMKELPSPCFRGAPQPPPPPPPRSASSSNGGCGSSAAANTGGGRSHRWDVCPMFEAFAFCIYGNTCLLPHRQSAAAATTAGSEEQAADVVRPRLPRPPSREAALADVIAMGHFHMNHDEWTCYVCGLTGIRVESTVKVGETYAYRYCPNCTTACYLPHVLHLVEWMVEDVGDDYQLYKTLTDEYRAAVPDLLKIPLTFEAHRMATTIFAWTLFSPLDAQYALDTIVKYLPAVEAVVSLGAGTGYIEHVLNRVANGVGPVPSDPKVPGRISSFAGARDAVIRRRPSRLSFFAFDEIIRPAHYSVVVNYGNPNVLRSLRCAESVLLLSWPPFGSAEEEQSSMGFEALRSYHACGGRVVLYVGDTSSTGDWRFHNLLNTEYGLCKEYYVRKEVRRWYPQEMGLVFAGCDTVGLYLRR